MTDNTPWTCSVCGTENAADADQCTKCGRLRAVEPAATHRPPANTEEEPIEVDLEVDRGFPAINP